MGSWLLPTDSTLCVYGLVKPPTTTPVGHIHKALRHLKTSYSLSLKTVAATPSPSCVGLITSASTSPQPTARSRDAPPRISLASSASNTVSISPVMSAAVVATPPPSTQNGATAVDAPVVGRLNHVFDPRSSRTLGMRRLPITEVVRLRRGDEVTVVVTSSPPTSRADRVSASTNARRALLDGFGRVVVAALPCPLASRGDHDLHIDRNLGERTVDQADKPFFEFNIRIANYPERALLALPDPLPIDINHWLGADRAGLNLELIGYDAAKRVLLQLSTLPCLQVYKSRDPGAQFLDPALEFNKCATDPKTASRKLARALHVTRGDSAATVAVMMNYYKTNSLNRQNNDVQSNIQSLLDVEIGGSALELFADAVNAHYEAQMTLKMSDFSDARSHLVSDDAIAQFYSRLRQDLPTCHLMFVSVVSTKHYRVPTGEECNPVETEQD